MQTDRILNNCTQKRGCMNIENDPIHENEEKQHVAVRHGWKNSEQMLVLKNVMNNVLEQQDGSIKHMDTIDKRTRHHIHQVQNNDKKMMKLI